MDTASIDLSQSHLIALLLKYRAHVAKNEITAQAAAAALFSAGTSIALDSFSREEVVSMIRKAAAGIETLPADTAPTPH